MRLVDCCPITRMETIFMNTEINKTNAPVKFLLKVTQRLHLRSSNKHVALQNLSINYSLKNIRQQYKNNKLKIIAGVWDDEIELPDRSFSVSDVPDYFEFIIKKYKTFPANPPIHIYISRINNKLLFKMKDGYS